MSWPTSPSREFKGTQRYHKKQYLSIQQQGASPCWTPSPDTHPLAWSPRSSQNALGKPACSRTPFAVCRLTIPIGTGKRRLGDRAVPDLMTALPGPGKGTAGALQQSAQLAIEGRRHSRRGHHRERLHALGDNVQLDLVARRCKPVFGRDLGRDFEHARDKLFKGRCLGRQRQLVIRAPPHAGLVVPLRRDLESLAQDRHPLPDRRSVSEMVAEGGE